MRGTGYDLSTSIYSQDGRIFQIEYATKAIDNAETVVGFCVDGAVILACEKIRQSALETEDANKRLYSVDAHIGIGLCGRLPDGHNVVSRARKECESYRKTFGVSISGVVLAERLANYVQAHTSYGQFRPLGCAIFIVAYDEAKFSLYLIENSGLLRKYKGCSQGKGRQTARTHLDKLEGNVSVDQGLRTVAKAIVAAHEEFKEKTYELEIAMISEKTGFEFKMLELEERKQLRKAAEDELEEQA